MSGVHHTRFSRVPKRQFTPGEKVYVIGERDSLLPAELISVSDTSFLVRHPHFSEPVNIEKSRIVPATRRNNHLYARQSAPASSVSEDEPSSDADSTTEDDVDTPRFEFLPNHEFALRERVYVIDVNRYDIFPATIEDIKRTKCLVDFPEYPEEYGWIPKNRILVVTPVNRAIFDEQERVRAESSEPKKSSDAEEDENAVASYARRRRKRPKKKKTKLTLTLDFDAHLLQAKDVEITLRIGSSRNVRTHIRKVK
jgi:hypothetical protein